MASANWLPGRAPLGAAGLAMLLGAQVAGAAPPASAQAPTAREVIERQAAARGGAAAWARVQSMGWTGHVESSAQPTGDVSFLMLFQRPDATRFEVVKLSQHSVRAYDGKRGWKLRPGGERGTQLDDYTPAELGAARDAGGLDGPLIDPAAKGIDVALEGADEVEGHKAWRLRVTLPSGTIQHHWVDASTWLDLRYDRQVRDREGRAGTVWVYLRDYRRFGEVVVPLVVETRATSGEAWDRLVIEKVAINPPIEPGTFNPPDTRPMQGTRHGGVIVNAVPKGGSESRPNSSQ